MNQVKGAWVEGKNKAESFSDLTKYIIFSLMSVLIFSEGSWIGYSIFIFLMILLEYALRYNEGEFK